MLPLPVRQLRAEIGRADALIISSPEYARRIAGSLKNLLDCWSAASSSPAAGHWTLAVFFIGQHAHSFCVVDPRAGTRERRIS